MQVEASPSFEICGLASREFWDKEEGIKERTPGRSEELKTTIALGTVILCKKKIIIKRGGVNMRGRKIENENKLNKQREKYDKYEIVEDDQRESAVHPT